MHDCSPLADYPDLKEVRNKASEELLLKCKENALMLAEKISKDTTKLREIVQRIAECELELKLVEIAKRELEL